MNIISPINFLAQKLLYSWIRTETIQSTVTRSKDKNSVVVYVLESRAWSDLLVAEHECRVLHITRPRSRIRHRQLKKWHHVYTVAQAQPLKAWLQNKTKHSKMLTGIHQVLTDNPELDVHFVPVVVFWGRSVVKQKHWLRVLFSDTWGFAGRTRRFFTILFNGKNTLIQFSPAISFRQIIENTRQQANSVDALQSLLSRRLTEIKTATLGPDISHRRTLVLKLLENSEVENAITKRCATENISYYRAAKTAHAYLNEIVADRNYITIQILQRILSAFWNRFYSGIKVHFSGRLKTLALSHELVYVPCHRSHIDYLLLSYVIHREGLAIPYIAAGKNLNMPIIGPVLRKGGAFFIRRSFKGNELYSTVLFEYLATQLATGMPIEYFVEGGRSRTGRLLQPKPGMLSMTIRAYLKYQQRPIAFVPVYIGYEKMMESKSYLSELKGESKTSETFINSIRSILNIRGLYGRVTVNFAQPILLNDVLNEQDIHWNKQPYNDQQRPEWLRPAVSQTSRLVMRGINASCAVNAVNLVATALLAAPNQALDEGELIRILSLYTELINRLNYSDDITLPHFKALSQIHHAEALGMVRRRKHEMGDFIYLDSAHAVLLTYYRNNVLHLFVMPALIASCFNNAATLDREKITRYTKIAYPFLGTEFFLPWEPSELEKVVDDILQCFSATGLLDYSNADEVYIRPRISTDAHAQLSGLAHIISPLLELYYMIFALLAEDDSSILTQLRLEELCYLMAQRLSLMYEINSPDFFDKKLISNFINTLIELGYVTVNENSKLELSDYALNEGRRARRLLDKNMQYNILQMLRTSSKNLAPSDGRKNDKSR